VLWLIEHSTSHQLLWCIDSFVLRNPPLRQVPDRQAVKKPNFNIYLQKNNAKISLEFASACLPESVFQTAIFC